MPIIFDPNEPTLLELAEQNLKRLISAYAEGKLNDTEKDFFLGHSPSIMRGIEALYRIKYREGDLDLKKNKSQSDDITERSIEEDMKILKRWEERKKNQAKLKKHHGTTKQGSSERSDTA